MGGKAKYLLRGRKRPPTFPWCQTVGGPFRALSGARKCLPTRPGHESGARDGRGRPAILTFPTKVPSDSLGWIGSLKRTSDKSLFPMALGSCGHRITHQLRPINMNGRSILAVTSKFDCLGSLYSFSWLGQAVVHPGLRNQQQFPGSPPHPHHCVGALPRCKGRKPCRISLFRYQCLLKPATPLPSKQ